MAQIPRSGTRYKCSQKAVLLREDGVRNIGVITNVSNGGLCLAVIGSARHQTSARVGVKIKRRTFSCSIVNKSAVGLHCRFEKRRAVPNTKYKYCRLLFRVSQGTAIFQ